MPKASTSTRATPERCARALPPAQRAFVYRNSSEPRAPRGSGAPTSSTSTPDGRWRRTGDAQVSRDARAMVDASRATLGTGHRPGDGHHPRRRRRRRRGHHHRATRLVGMLLVTTKKRACPSSAPFPTSLRAHPTFPRLLARARRTRRRRRRRERTERRTRLPSPLGVRFGSRPRPRRERRPPPSPCAACGSTGGTVRVLFRHRSSMRRRERRASSSATSTTTSRARARARASRVKGRDRARVARVDGVHDRIKRPRWSTSSARSCVADGVARIRPRPRRAPRGALDEHGAGRAQCRRAPSAAGAAAPRSAIDAGAARATRRRSPAARASRPRGRRRAVFDPGAPRARLERARRAAADEARRRDARATTRRWSARRGGQRGLWRTAAAGRPRRTRVPRGGRCGRRWASQAAGTVGDETRATAAGTPTA